MMTAARERAPLDSTARVTSSGITDSRAMRWSRPRHDGRLGEPSGSSSGSATACVSGRRSSGVLETIGRSDGWMGGVHEDVAKDLRVPPNTAVGRSAGRRSRTHTDTVVVILVSPTRRDHHQSGSSHGCTPDDTAGRGAPRSRPSSGDHQAVPSQRRDLPGWLVASGRRTQAGHGLERRRGRRHPCRRLQISSPTGIATSMPSSIGTSISSRLGSALWQRSLSP